MLPVEKLSSMRLSLLVLNSVFNVWSNRRVVECTCNEPIPVVRDIKAFCSLVWDIPLESWQIIDSGENRFVRALQHGFL